MNWLVVGVKCQCRVVRNDSIILGAELFINYTDEKFPLCRTPKLLRGPGGRRRFAQEISMLYLPCSYSSLPGYMRASSQKPFVDGESGGALTSQCMFNIARSTWVPGISINLDVCIHSAEPSPSWALLAIALEIKTWATDGESLQHPDRTSVKLVAATITYREEDSWEPLTFIKHPNMINASEDHGNKRRMTTCYLHSQMQK
ncbi:hypothetical protein KC324_g21 [Hortaea werneckii]|nr:hypothetical protein KC324_g21 [Hortaea werneckii]